MMEKESQYLYLQIAGYNIQVIFDDVVYSHLRQTIYHELISHYANFILHDKPGIIHHTIQFSFKNRLSRVSVRNVGSFLLVEKKVSQKRTILYYSASIFHFEMTLLEVLTNLLTREGGFYLHASSVAIDDQALIFIGPSGAGKSTMTMLLKDVFTPLVDDALFIKKEKKEYILYQSPFYEKNNWFRKSNAKFRIKHIFFLHKSTETKIKKISHKGITASFFLQQAFNKDFSSKQTISNALEFYKYHEYYDFYFRKNRQEVVQSILRICHHSKLDTHHKHPSPKSC